MQSAVDGHMQSRLAPAQICFRSESCRHLLTCKVSVLEARHNAFRLMGPDLRPAAKRIRLSRIACIPACMNGNRWRVDRIRYLSSSHSTTQTPYQLLRRALSPAKQLSALVCQGHHFAKATRKLKPTLRRECGRHAGLTAPQDCPGHTGRGAGAHTGACAHSSGEVRCAVVDSVDSMLRYARDPAS